MENQRTYIEENLDKRERERQEGGQQQEQQRQEVMSGEEHVAAAPTAEPVAPPSNFMNLLGFENATTYIDLDSGMGMEQGKGAGVAPTGLDTNAEGERAGTCGGHVRVARR